MGGRMQGSRKIDESDNSSMLVATDDSWFSSKNIKNVIQGPFLKDILGLTKLKNMTITGEQPWVISVICRKFS